MVNYLELGARTLQSRMERYAGIEAIYRRNGVFSFPITVVPGRNPVEVVDQNGFVIKGQIQDFTVDIEKMRNRMPPGDDRPMRGDEIVIELGKDKVVFVVNSEGFTTGHYEPSDSYGVAWRIHTKSDRILNA